MLLGSVALFAVAALFGLTIAIRHFQGNTPPPVSLAVLHGVFAAAGIVILLSALWPDFSGPRAWSLVLFVLAAVGGFTLALGFHMRGKPLPSGFIAAHGLLAVLSFVILLIAVFKP